MKQAIQIVLIVVLFLLLLITFFALETTQIAPDSPLYPIDTVFDDGKIALQLDEFDKAGAEIEVADERLLETKEMIEKAKMEEAGIAAEAHEKLLEDVKKNIENKSQTNETNEINESYEGLNEVQNKLEDHKDKIEIIKKEFEEETPAVNTTATDNQTITAQTIIKQLETKTDEIIASVEHERKQLVVELNIIIEENKRKAQEMKTRLSKLIEILEKSEKHLDKADIALKNNKTEEAIEELSIVTKLQENASKLMEE